MNIFIIIAFVNFCVFSLHPQTQLEYVQEEKSSFLYQSKVKKKIIENTVESILSLRGDLDSQFQLLIQTEHDAHTAFAFILKYGKQHSVDYFSGLSLFTVTYRLLHFIFQKFPLKGSAWKNILHQLNPQEAHLLFHSLLLYGGDSGDSLHVGEIINLAPHLKPYCGLRTLLTLYMRSPKCLFNLLEYIGKFTDESLYLHPDPIDLWPQMHHNFSPFLESIGIPKHIGNAKSTLLMEAIAKRAFGNNEESFMDTIIQFLIENHIDTSVTTSRGHPLYYYIYMLSCHIRSNTVRKQDFAPSFKLLQLYLNALKTGTPMDHEQKIFLDPWEAEKRHADSQGSHIAEHLNFPLLSLFSIGHIPIVQFYETIFKNFSMEKANHFERHVLHILALSTLPSRNLEQYNNPKGCFFHDFGFESRLDEILETYPQWINHPDIDGMTPLMYAVHHPTLFEKLLNQGAQTTFKDKRGWPLKVHVWLCDNPKTKEIYQKYTRDFVDVSLDDIFYNQTPLKKQLQYMVEDENRPLSSHPEYNFYLKTKIKNLLTPHIQGDPLKFFLNWIPHNDYPSMSFKKFQAQKEFNRKITQLLETNAFQHRKYGHIDFRLSLLNLEREGKTDQVEKALSFFIPWAISIYLSQYPEKIEKTTLGEPDRSILLLAEVIITFYIKEESIRNFILFDGKNNLRTDDDIAHESSSSLFTSCSIFSSLTEKRSY